MREAVLALDIGTSGARAALVGIDGEILDRAQTRYGFHCDERTGTSEQDPEEVLAQVLAVIGRCCAGGGVSIRAVSAASAMHSLMLVDETGRPLTPLSLWGDSRAKRQCEAYRQAYRQGGWHGKTGCLLSPSYPFPRLLWYRENHPQLFGRFARAVSIKAYVLFRMTGLWAEDECNASGSGLMNLRSRAWDGELLSYAGLSADRLPELVPTEQAIFRGRPALISVPGVEDATVWIAGAGDGPLCHRASAGDCVSTASLSIGTSAAARLSPGSVEPGSLSEQIWCYVLDAGRHVLGLSSSNGGSVLEWGARALFPGGPTLAQLDEALGNRPSDPQLFFLPYLYPERDALITRRPQAGFAGVKPHHDAFDLLRAVVEGIAFHAAALHEELAKTGGTRVVVSGGAARLTTLRSVLAELLDEMWLFADGADATLLGAADLAWTALGATPRRDRPLRRDPGPPSSASRDKYDRWKEIARGRVSE
ncbi:MAG: hypothetical protein HY900_12455 [Deltaproteobacteria bacterium]|nr:hypothetical protein [Deltaproteobacteria bacterium]